MASRVFPARPDIIPAAPPRLIDNVYSPAQHAALMDMIRDYGPWPMVTKGRFQNVEQIAASGSGRIDANVSMDQFIVAQFRGWVASHGTSYFTELDDIFFDARLRAHARDYWGAQFARPTFMYFSLSGPFEATDPGHIDGLTFRGIRKENAPLWILSLMGKSGLFDRWMVKMTQVVAWWSRCPIGGFTYWPDGIAAQPQRVTAPLWNKALIVQNERMFHRPESNGPPERRHYPGLTFDTELGVDPANRDRWLMKTGDVVNAELHTDDLRLMLHWNAEVYHDLDDLKLHSDHRDDLTHEMVAEIFIADLRRRGVTVDPPSDPYNDMAFIGLLNDTYDPGRPRIYPPGTEPRRRQPVPA
jgi:hypothetical protein